MEKGMVTMREVAKAAGVSVATVSRALSGDPHCGERTRRQVEEVATRMNYRPDPGVSALARRRLGKSNAYPLVWLKEQARGGGAGYEKRLGEGIRRKADALGYSVEIVSISALGGPRAASRILYQRGVRGILVPSLNEPATLEDFDWSAFSVVAYDQENFAVPFDTVQPDHYGNFFEAIIRARRAGHRRIGVVLPSAAFARQNELILGAVHYHRVESTGEAVPPLILKPQADGSTEHYPGATREWYLAHRPTVVVSKTEGAYWPILDAGLRCPEDFSFVTTNLEQGTLDYCAGFDPQLEEIAAQLLSRIDSLIRQGQRGRRKAPVTVTIRSAWRDGRSLSAPERKE